ncbi:hypothetical protein HDU97_006438 [Phlyctochytrium planicorne]|nr:hypothetical protein HDU97_006438 [Phlyctochytrium planicorne]
MLTSFITAIAVAAAGANAAAVALEARAGGLISVPAASIALIGVYKDVSENQVCGAWTSPNDNGTASYIFADCDAASTCFKPGSSRIGLCVKQEFAAVGSTSDSGTTCGYSIQTPLYPIPYFAGTIVLEGCPAGKACKFASKSDVKGSCLDERGSSDPPMPKTDIVTAKVGEQCGTFLSAAAEGKSVKLVRAKCAAGSICNFPPESPLSGKCDPYKFAFPGKYSNDGRCGYYLSGGIVACAKGNCIFPDSKSLTGFCPEFVSPTPTPSPTPVPTSDPIPSTTPVPPTPVPTP